MFEKAGIRRVLMNIFGNSLKFTSDGYVHVVLREAPEQPDERSRLEDGRLVTSAYPSTPTRRAESCQLLSSPRCPYPIIFLSRKLEWRAQGWRPTLRPHDQRSAHARRAAPHTDIC